MTNPSISQNHKPVSTYATLIIFGERASY